MSGILDMFRSAETKPATPEPNAGEQPNPNGSPNDPNNMAQPKTEQSDKTDANGVVPEGAADDKDKSPLDEFSNFWDNDPNAKPPENYKVESVDPAKLKEVMGKVDLTKALDQETLAAINAGGEGAQAAMLKALNTVAQQSMMQSTVVANKMLEDTVTKMQSSMESKMEDLIKRNSLNAELTNKNPIFDNPAVKPVIQAVQHQLSLKNPNASTTELATMAESFVTAMAESFNPNAGKTTEPGGEETKAEDWGKFLDDAPGLTF